jgi:hypothetical protein
MAQIGNADLLARISVLEEQMERILGNGQPGLIAELEHDVSEVKTDVSGIRAALTDARWKAVVFFCILITAVIAAGSGTVSLKTLIELFTK